MEQVMTVKRMVARYGCSTKTAVKYIRQMTPHMENPVSAPMYAFHEWEKDRTVFPTSTSKKRKHELIKKQNGKTIVPRHR